MKKLTLDLNQIQVVSFTVETTKDTGGTVEGFSPAGSDVGCEGTGVYTDYVGSCRLCQIVPSEVTNCGC